MKTLLLTTAFWAALLAAPQTQAAPTHKVDFDASWTRPVKPFNIAGNVYYVGTEGLSAYLIVAGKQAILLDGTLAQNAPLIERNIEALGFRLSDVKVIVNSHAHLDHAGAIARLKHDTGAQFYASAGDRWALERGMHDGETDYPRGHFPAVAVDHVLRDGEVIRLGGVRMTATLTPGHTRGCTTWSTQVIVPQNVLDVVFPCSLTVAGNILVRNRAYPNIVADYRHSFTVLDKMKADIVLTNHPDVADVMGREQRKMAGDKTAFIDPTLLHRIVASSRTDFEAQLSAAEGPKKPAGSKS